MMRNITRTIHEYRKSTILAMIFAYTRISLGKYIFVIKLLLLTRTPADELRLETKRFQGSKATERKIIYGTPKEGILRIVEKTKLTTIIWIKGFIITHA